MTNHSANTQSSPTPIAQVRQDGNGGKARVVIYCIAGLCVLAIAGFCYWLYARQFETTDDAYIDAQIVFVAPQVAGIVQNLPVQANQHVSPGDLLAVINPDTTASFLSQQEAGKSQATAQDQQAQAQLRVTEARLAQARASAVGSQADLQQATSDLDRLLNLQSSDSGAVAPARIDAAKTQVADAKAAANVAAQAAQAAEADVETARAGIGSASALSRAADARVQQARITFDQYRITAPLAGHIANLSVNQGSYVAPGMHMMALVPNEVWVTANFKETQIESIQSGQDVDISIDAYPDVLFKGKVVSIQRAAGQAFDILPSQNATGNFVKVVQTVPVKISILSPDPLQYSIGPGMSAVPKVYVLRPTTDQ